LKSLMASISPQTSWVKRVASPLFSPGSSTGRRIFWLSYIAVSAWVLLFLAVNNQADMDLWGVMSFGALLDQNPGRFPYQDPFSYTAGHQPWVYHEWGSGMVFYQAFKAGGSQALFWLKLLLVEVMLVFSTHRYLLGGLSRMDKPPGRFSEAVFAAALPVAVYLLLPDVDTTIRCQLFTFTGFSMFLFLLERHAQNRLRYTIWLMPLGMLLWTNLHGGFIMGLGLLGVYLLHHWFAGRKRESENLAMVLLLSALATMANPYGLRFWETMRSAWLLPREHIAEWGNILTLHLPLYGGLYIALVLFGLLLGLAQWRRQRDIFPVHLLLLASTGLYGGLHYKLAPLYLITFLSIGLQSLEEDLPVLRAWFGASFTRKLKNPWPAVEVFIGKAFPVLTVWTCTVLLAFGVFLNVFYWQHQQNPLAVQVPGLKNSRAANRAAQFAYPLQVTGYLQRRHIHGNLWAPFAWGEFMYWVLYPQCRISIDGRYETLYSPSIFDDYYRFYHPPFALEAAERYPTTHILVEADQPELLHKLRRSRRWHEIYRDPQAVLFSRHAEPLEVQTGSIHSIPLDHYRGELNRFQTMTEL
jgi:hypothetical protein